MYYFDGFGVETPPLFLEEYVGLGSDEKIQEFDESCCGAYCLYMIYLIDKRFGIKISLYNLINQVKCRGMHNECLCLGCKDRVNVKQGTCFADVNVNENVSDNVNVNDNVNTNDNVNVNQGNCFPDVNDNVNQRCSFTDDIDSEDEVDIYLLREKPPGVKPLSPLARNSHTSRVSQLFCRLMLMGVYNHG